MPNILWYMVTKLYEVRITMIFNNKIYRFQNNKILTFSIFSSETRMVLPVTFLSMQISTFRNDEKINFLYQADFLKGLHFKVSDSFVLIECIFLPSILIHAACYWYCVLKVGNDEIVTLKMWRKGTVFKRIIILISHDLNDASWNIDNYLYFIWHYASCGKSFSNNHIFVYPIYQENCLSLRPVGIASGAV